MHADFVDLLRALSEADARFLVVGGYAVAAHGHPRATGDLDLWVDATPENARRVRSALAAFGAPLRALSERDLATPGIVFQMGVPPRRIDVLTSVSGLEFAATWATHMTVTLGTVTMPVIGLEALLTNKRAAGRPKDLLDVTALEALRPRRRRPRPR